MPPRISSIFLGNFGRVQPPLGLHKTLYSLCLQFNKIFLSLSAILPSVSIPKSPFFSKFAGIFRKFISRLLQRLVGFTLGKEEKKTENKEESDRENDDSDSDGSRTSSHPEDSSPQGATEIFKKENDVQDEPTIPVVVLDNVVDEDESGSAPNILEEEMPIVDEPQSLFEEDQTRTEVKKKALLIGIKKLRSASGEEAVLLNGPHRDVADMRGLLEGIYGYRPEDIISLIDNDDPREVQPTKENILSQINQLLGGARNGDRFFFFFAGHSMQEDTDDLLEEEDGKNEFIVASDSKTIMDNELRERLIDPLPLKCSLIAVFDTCHSCSLLDLPHFRCNRVYVPWINRGNRRTDTLWASNQRRLELPFLSQTERQGSLTSPTLRQRALTGQFIRQRNTAISSEFDQETAQGKHPFGSRPKLLDLHVQGVAQSEPELVPVSFLGERHFEDAVDSPVSIFCDGNCRKSPIWSQRKDDEPKADVICLSSSKDSQVTWEDPLGNSMTRCLVTFLKENPKRSLKEVLSHVSHSIYNRYVDLHDQARGYKKEVKKINTKRLRVGKRPLIEKNVEMHNFQDPQISSHHPLDMNRYFEP